MKLRESINVPPAHSLEGTVREFEYGETTREIVPGAAPGNPWCSFRLDSENDEDGFQAELVFYGRFPLQLRDGSRVRVHRFDSPHMPDNAQSVGGWADLCGDKLIQPNLLIDGVEVLTTPEGDPIELVIKQVRRNAHGNPILCDWSED